MQKLDLKDKEIIKFGHLISALLLVASVFIYMKESNLIAYILISLFLLNLIISFFFPVINKPLYVLWIKIGSIIGKVVNPLVLGVIFFCIITPTAIIIRLMGRDELRLKMSQKKSYWIERKEDLKPTSFNNQF